MASEAHPGLSPQNIKLKQRFEELGATPFYEKCLTNSDTGTQGRVVIPKVCALIMFVPPPEGEAGYLWQVSDQMHGHGGKY
jgi:hypothetical protein